MNVKLIENMWKSHDGADIVTNVNIQYRTLGKIFRRKSKALPNSPSQVVEVTWPEMAVVPFATAPVTRAFCAADVTELDTAVTASEVIVSARECIACARDLDKLIAISAHQS